MLVGATVGIIGAGTAGDGTLAGVMDTAGITGAGTLVGAMVGTIGAGDLDGAMAGTIGDGTATIEEIDMPIMQEEEAL